MTDPFEELANAARQSPSSSPSRPAPRPASARPSSRPAPRTPARPGQKKKGLNPLLWIIPSAFALLILIVVVVLLLTGSRNANFTIESLSDTGAPAWVLTNNGSTLTVRSATLNSTRALSAVLHSEVPAGLKEAHFASCPITIPAGQKAYFADSSYFSIFTSSGGVESVKSIRFQTDRGTFRWTPPQTIPTAE